MKTKHLLTSTGLAAAVVVVLTWLLIPILGLQGAAWAMVASNLSMYVIRVVMARPIIRITVNRPLMLLNIALVCAQACVMVRQLNGYPVISWIVFVAVCVVSVLDIYPSIRSLLGVVSNQNNK